MHHAQMKWNELDQAYLEIFGEHPDLPDVRWTGAVMSEVVLLSPA